MPKPGIIVVSQTTDTKFDWMSDGWYRIKIRHTKKAKDLFTKAHKCIDAAGDVPDAIKRLKTAGFTIKKRSEG